MAEQANDSGRANIAENTGIQDASHNINDHDRIESSGRKSFEMDSPESEETVQKNCCAWYWQDCVWPGMGLFGESYLLFSIGTMQPIWEILFEECFSEECSPALLAALHYSVVLGVIFGMLVIGYAAKHTGRRKGSLTTALLMLSGAAGLTMTSFFLTGDQQTLVRSMVFFWFVFGTGVGGEYPLSAAQASENATEKILRNKNHRNANNDEKGDGLLSEQEASTSEGQIPSQSMNNIRAQSRRGRQVQLVFSMQGLGILLNSVTMTALLFILNQHVDMLSKQNWDNQQKAAEIGDDYIYKKNDVQGTTETALLSIWRTTYMFGTLVLFFVFYTRYLYLEESKIWKNHKRLQGKVEDQQPSQIFFPPSPPRKQSSIAQDGSDLIGAELAPPASQNETDHSSAVTSAVSGLRAVAHGSHEETPHIATLPGLENNRSQTPTAAVSGNYALNIVPSALSMDSTVSSLSAPSVATHNYHADEEHFFHFLPEVRTTGLTSTWGLLWKHYSVRLIGASLCWMLWDVAFYGNKLFQSTFLMALIGRNADGENQVDDDQRDEGSDAASKTLLDFSICATVNALVAFAGYIVAAFLVDQPLIGRRRLQQWGLFVTGALFVVCGFLLEAGSSSSGLVIALYLGTSFFGQMGPNATTFLVPAEIFPTELRTFCHGIAAASGKVGALLAAVAFNFTHSDFQMFLLSGYCCLMAGLLTFYTIPESLGLPLEEIDSKWSCIVHNKPYTGLANQSRYLSFYERRELIRRTYSQNNAHESKSAYDASDLLQSLSI